MARFQLSSLFTDHAVLCRNKEIRIFGRAEESVRLTACLTDSAGRTLASDQACAESGAFMLRFPPQTAQTGCTLTVSDGGQRAEAHDIAIGDVYLANGQSNMELELQNADEGRTLVRTHENPWVRYYNVPKYPRDGEEAEQANRDARWRTIAPGIGADMSAAAYFFAMKLQPEIGVPVGIVDCYWGGTSISCWMDRETLEETDEGRRYIREYDEKCAGKTLEQYLVEEAAANRAMEEWGAKAEKIKETEPDIRPQELNARLGPFPWNPPVGIGSPFRPFGLHQTMLRRVIPFTLTGVLYYQGEEDTWRTQRYDVLLTSFVCMLRRKFLDENLPFLNVQLPMWIDANGQDGKLWPRLRMAQHTVYRNLRNTGLAILLDQGEYDNIHPTNKRVVGERLFLEALEVVYHREAAKAVFAESKYTENGTLVVCLSAPAVDCGEGEWLMEIAGEDGGFVQAEAVLDKNRILLRSDQLKKPVKARYAWTDYAKVRLFGENGLPVAPFLLE